jgi:hypothetical protein
MLAFDFRAQGTDVEPDTEGLVLSEALVRFERFQNDYNIRVLLEDVPCSTDLYYSLLKGDDSASLCSFCGLLDVEMRKYPAQLLAVSGIESVALVKDLRWNDIPVMGLASSRLRTIYFDISAFQTTDSAAANERQKLIMHHEIFHLIDVAINGPECFVRDRAWPQRRRSRSDFSPAALDFDTSGKRPGFLFGHGAPNVGEDKADVFAFCMVESAYERIIPRLQSDQLLRAKFEYMRSLVQGVVPEMETLWPQLPADM